MCPIFALAFECILFVGFVVVGSRAAEIQHASVRFQFEVLPTSPGSYQIVNISSARRFFPPEDILITSFTFDGVRVQGVKIFDHMTIHEATAGEAAAPPKSINSIAEGLPSLPPGMKWAPLPINKLVYHHSLLHTGSQAGFSHAHGGIVYGTPGGGTNKTTSFYPYGVRLRPEAIIFTCLHAQNLLELPILFETKWDIAFEVLKTTQPDPRALITGWVHTSAEVHEVNSVEALKGFFHLFQVVFAKSVRVVCFVVHNHAWAKSITVEHRNQTVLSLNLRQTVTHHEGMENSKHWHLDDKKLKWFDTPEHVQRGESLMVNFTGKYVDDYDWAAPLGFSFYVVCDDMTDHVNRISDLYIVRGLSKAAHAAFVMSEPDPFP
jgi:hypothetical protein